MTDKLSWHQPALRDSVFLKPATQGRRCEPPILWQQSRRPARVNQGRERGLDLPGSTIQLERLINVRHSIDRSYRD